MKQTIRKYIPSTVLLGYHWCLAQLGALLYGHPAKKMLVIGVTGTKGKSTVVNLVEQVFRQAGYKTGLISTIQFKRGEKVWLNDTKQTMPGRFKLQKMLKDMLLAGCNLAVIETSSEGIAQYRHLGIDYDVAVFTNISPEHIESHGSYKKYRQAKTKIFEQLTSGKRKYINGREIKKYIVANHDDEEVEHFLVFKADKKYTFGFKQPGNLMVSDEQVLAREVKTEARGISFVVDGVKIDMNLLGEFNVYNALAAIAAGFTQGLELEQIKKALEKIQGMPGRMEEITNDKGFRVFVDYAHEPASLEAAYQAMQAMKPKKVISVLGSQGGGRDKAKRPELGKLAAEHTDHVIVTNEDPYDESPEQIIDDVVNGATQAYTKPPIEKIVDRKEAIKKALSLAEAGDVVIITGKGSESVMAVEDSKKIPWDDRKIVRELIK